MRERGWSARELARRAGLKPESQLSGILTRLRGDPDAIELRTLKKIAAGAEVPWEWLLTGRDDLVEAALRARPFRELPAWPSLLEAARALAPAIPEWAWQAVADSQPVVRDTITAGQIAELAAYVARFAPPPATLSAGK
jgi:transcriptional regulator with XRE-family HTH domain